MPGRERCLVAAALPFPLPAKQARLPAHRRNGNARPIHGCPWIPNQPLFAMDNQALPAVMRTGVWSGFSFVEMKGAGSGGVCLLNPMIAAPLGCFSVRVQK